MEACGGTAAQYGESEKGFASFSARRRNVFGNEPEINEN
jgi:hypothetical protein